MKRSLRILPFLAFSTTAFAQNVLQIELVPWVMGLDTITDITYSHPGDSRLFVVQKQGFIRIVSDSMTVVPAPFLNIHSQVLTAGHEQGLLGLAFDPDYANNGYFYTNYIAGTGAGVSVISRWGVSADPNVADTASEEIIYTYPQPYDNHNGGDLNFGPDGYLYIALGDGGDAGDPQGHAQDLSDPLGDILRLDVSDPDTTYTIPSDNPFVGNTGDTLPEIWASGLRNPFRFSFDRFNGDLWLGDVGQSAWEEVDYVEAGSAGGHNFGWRCYEGTAPFNTIDCAAMEDYTQPVTVHINDGQFSDWCSVIGGFVYRGSLFPHLYGRYIYTDYCKQQFWSLREDGTTFVDEMLLEDLTLSSWTTFGENAAGELFVGNEFPGDIYMIADKCPMDAPTLTFDGVTLASTFADSTYMWFQDNLLIPGENSSTYVPTQNGDYYVVAVFTNGCMLSSDTLSVIVTGVPSYLAPAFSLQPNPANNEVTITWTHGAAVDILRILDHQGREVRAMRPTSTRAILEVDDLAAGNYVVQLMSRENAVLAASPLVVNH